jgi:hypothetical protein
MNRRHRFAGVLAAAGLAVVSVQGQAPAPSAPPPARTDPYIQLAVARAQVEIVLRETPRLVDDAASGWEQAWNATDEAWEEVAGVYRHAIEREEQREEDMRNGLYLDTCRQKLEARERQWRGFQKKRQALRLRLDEGRRALEMIAQMAERLPEIERAWKGTGADLQVLLALFAELEKRAMIVSTGLRKTLDDHAAMNKEWTELLAVAENDVRR